MKRYGPYRLGDGHLIWSDTHDDGTRHTVLVHREVMEQHLGRKLTADEVVHHINKDPSDNRLENLTVMSVAEHASHHARHAEMATLVCCECGATFQRTVRQERSKASKRTAGPFCGKSCQGSWSGRQWGRGRTVGTDLASIRACGTRSAYRNGCRCALCRAQHAAAHKQYRNKNQTKPA